MGLQLLVTQVNDAQEIEKAIMTLVERGAGALLVGSGPFFGSNMKIVIELASRHALPSSYTQRQAAVDGGLISYGTDLIDALRQGGNYVGRVLKGEKPGDLPVMRSTKFELVLNITAYSDNNGMIRPCAGLDSKSRQGGGNDEQQPRPAGLGFDDCAFPSAEHSISASRSRRMVASADGNIQLQGYGPTRSTPRARA